MKLATRTYTQQDEVDVVVVGTGAGGAPLIARLARAGLQVVALEAGQAWDAARDFATDEKAQEILFWNDERLSAGGDPLPFGRNNSGCGVGGGTLHYTAYVPRPRPEDFRLQTEFGVGADWPLDPGELRPYFDEVERFLGVSGPSPYPWEPDRTPYPLPPLPRNGPAQLMERGCAALGIRTAPAANAALSAPYFQEGVGWRQPCTNRGFCQAGCSIGAKGSADVTFLPYAVGHGAEIRPGCFAVGVEQAADGRITALRYVTNGVEKRQRCRVVVLAAGAIETPRFLLMNDLANASGQVGRNFMAHVGMQVWGTFPEDARPNKGIPGGLISEDMLRCRHDGFAGGYVLQSIGIMPVTHAGQLARGRGFWGTGLREAMTEYNHAAGINILGDCLPSPSNFLELADERDARGLPKPRIHFTAGPNELAMGHHAESLMRSIWEAAGGTDIWSFPRFAHTIGTCGMGTDPAASVVNAEGRSHDIPNLWISDNSTFPSALGVNPSLMIMALALRTADALITRLTQRDA